MKKSQDSKSSYSEDDDSLPTLNSDSQVGDEVNSNSKYKPRRSNSYYKKGPRSDASNRNSGKYSRNGSKRSSYYKKDTDSLHSDANDRPKPRRRQSFNSQKSNQYQEQNGNSNNRYRRSYIKSNNSHYSNNSNRYNNNKSENYQREGSYNKGKGELLGKIKFMLKDGPRYISIHEVS